MSSLPTAQFTTPRGLTYHYIHYPATSSPSPSTTNKDPILILHGFPSVPTDFQSQITHLHTLGHTIIAPYLLGYHPTSTPTNPNTYRLKLICQDLIALLDHLQLSTISGIGHDWGATLLSRLEFYYPSRINRLAYLSIAPVPFGQAFDLDTVNEMTEQMTGQAMFGYQKFFMDHFDDGYAARILSERHDRLEMLLFAEDSGELWMKYFCALGGLEAWLGDDVDTDTRGVTMFKGLENEVLDRRRLTFTPKTKSSIGDRDSDIDTTAPPQTRESESRPGYAGPLTWYATHNLNLNIEDERAERTDWSEYTTDKDVLLVLGTDDPSAPPDMHVGMATAYVRTASEQLTVRRVRAGHFLMMQRAGECNAILREFLEDGVS